MAPQVWQRKGSPLIFTRPRSSNKIPNISALIVAPHLHFRAIPALDRSIPSFILVKIIRTYVLIKIITRKKLLSIPNLKNAPFPTPKSNLYSTCPRHINRYTTILDMHNTWNKIHEDTCHETKNASKPKPAFDSNQVA